MQRSQYEFDVVIIGGSISGASTAMTLMQHNPNLRVLIVERSEEFKRRVGEATIELTSYFLTHVLGLSDHLNSEHLVKQGLRFWFCNDSDTPFEKCSEIGGKYLARVAAFLVDRSVLDQEILRRAVEQGAELWRPARVESVELNESAQQSLKVTIDEQERDVSCRWVVDCSGVSAMLSRQLGHFQSTDEHQINAVWGRCMGVGNFDDARLKRRFPQWDRSCHSIRNTATNHLMGDGWWAWWIPLKSGEVSIGVVYNPKLFDWPTGPSLADQLRSVIQSHPVGREMFADATWCEDDIHLRKNLAYSSKTYVGDGYALVGDASAFLDPFYSSGLDWVAITSSCATRLITSSFAGEPIAPLIEKTNRDLRTSYMRWIDAIYRNRYEVLGDFELLLIGFYLDLGFYYLGVASQPYKRGPAALTEPMYSTAPSTPVYYLMRTYNRRLIKMARSRRARGVFGRKNSGRRAMLGGFTFGPGSAGTVFWYLLGWLRLEITEGWRTWFRNPPVISNQPEAESTSKDRRSSAPSNPVATPETVG